MDREAPAERTPFMEPDERRLVSQARRGAPEAVSELFHRHWQGAWRAAFAVCGRRDLANDVAQEAFLRALSRLDEFDESRPLGPWVRRIAVNARSTSFGASAGSDRYELRAFARDGVAL